MNWNIKKVIAAKALHRNIWFQGRPKKGIHLVLGLQLPPYKAQQLGIFLIRAVNQEGTVMSRIALIYPKLAIFRSRTQLTSPATTARNCDLMKNPSFNTQLGVVLMNLNTIQLTPVNTFSSHSAYNPGIQTASTLIQKDLFELASKALLELQESKNSSSLVLEVNLSTWLFFFVFS